MSPEQAKGEKVDHRTDIWSLGVMMYEMICGERPFKGDYEQAVIYSILNEKPKLLAKFRPDLPSELQNLVDRVMARSPEDRYQNAEEIVNDLTGLEARKGDSDRHSESPVRTGKMLPRKRLLRILVSALGVVIVAGFIYVMIINPFEDQEPTTIGTPVAEGTVQADVDNSIVVLPFKDISPAGDNEYFSDGLTEEIIADLSRIRSLRVISRTSAMTLKGTDMDMRAIGEKLDVRYVLEGSVRKAGDELKITAQLIDAVGDAHIWVEEYNGTMEDVFDIQEKVSRSIVEALKIELNPSENRMIADRPLDNSRAYELYLRALEKITHQTQESLDRALEDLDHGLQIVGENALIYSAMGYAYWQYINIGAKTFDEFSGKVEECVEKIFELEPESAHGYMLLARLVLFRGDTKGQVRYLLKVLERDPNNSDAIAWLAVAYTGYGKMEAAWRVHDILEKNDPLRPRLLLEKSYLYWMDGSFDLALKTIEEYKLHQFIMGARFFYSLLLVYHQRFEDASLSAASLDKEAPGSFYSRQMQFIIHAYKGEVEQAHKIITPEYIVATKQDYQYSIVAAVGYSLMDEKDQALYWLENAVDLGFYNYIYMSEHDPFFKTLRKEKRFVELMKYAKTQCDEFEVMVFNSERKP
jgi:TolB-like protein